VVAELAGGLLRVQLPGGAELEVSGTAGVGEEVVLTVEVARAL